MSTTRHPAAWFVAILTASVAANLHAQQVASTPALMVGVTGTAEMGGSFQGTLLLTRFEALASNDGIVAIGSISGALNGRSIVTKISMPVTVGPGSALQTAAVASPASCDAIRVGLEPSMFRALGSVVTLARSGVEITAPQGQATGSTVSSAGTTVGSMTPASSGIGTLGAFPTLAQTAGANGTAVPTSPVSSAIPGVISPPPQTRTPAFATSVQQLGQSLCSVSGLAQSSSSPAQLADALNRVMLALQP